MNVTINGKDQELPENATVADILRELGLESRLVAVECNGRIVPRDRHSLSLVAEGDRLEIVTLVGGG
ncbi:MAG: sulfur carrier protein ThiS [Planctomycetota bacterium]